MGCSEPVEHSLEVFAGELPLEWLGDLLVAAAEGQQRLLEREIGKLLGCSTLRWATEK